MVRKSKHDDDFAKIVEMKKGDGPLPRRPVDLSVFEPKKWFQKKLAIAKVKAVNILMPVFRQTGVIKFFGLYWVTRDADVRAVLGDHAAFNSPFGPEMQHLTQGVTFCLGNDAELHKRQTDALKIGMSNIDEDADVRIPARNIATALLKDSGGQVDVSAELIRQVVARLAADLLGCRVQNYNTFSDSLVAIGTLLFADPYGDRKTRDEGLLAARVMRPIIDDCTKRAMTLSQQQADGFDGIMPGMARGLRAYKDGRGDPEGAPYGDAEMRMDLDAIGYGMTTGFAVTHTFFAGILGTFGKRPKRLKIAIRLARDIADARADGDKTRETEKLAEFEQLMLEASRFMPAIQPGSFRVRTGVPLETSQTSRRTLRGLGRIPAGATAIVCTASAMQDPRSDHKECKRPRVFDQNRLAHDELTSSLGFGYGLHHCLGAQQAIAIASETLICLLSQPNIRFRDEKPKVRYTGAMPQPLWMAFDPVEGALRQTQITAALPFDVNCKHDDAMATLRGIQDAGALGASFTATNIVHFASLNVAMLGKRGKEHPHLLVEFNVDGGRDVALDQIEAACAGHQDACAALGQIVDLMPQAVRASVSDECPAAQVFFDRIREAAVELTVAPWGHTGLNFVGTGEFSVKQIAQERELADEVFSYLAGDGQSDAAHARGDTSGRADTDDRMPAEDWATTFFKNSRKKFGADERFADLFIRLPSRGPGFARAKAITFNQYLLKYAKQPTVLKIGGAWLATPVLALLAGPFFGMSGFSLFVIIWLAPLLLLISVLIALAFRLRAKERSEHADETRVDIHRLRQIRASEERPGYAQSHITSVSDFKLGVFRQLTFALAMHIIKSFVRLWFRPGFLTDFATIHYARWVRLKGTDQLVFQGNYDGSLESYLEDFITKVHAGQTLAWNNAEGFPKTSWLWFDGARNGDRFKRWVRNQQIETPFWFARFPDMTVPQIQMNALIRDGLARANDVSDHRAWLKLFGSVPRNGSELEADQVQSIMFNPHSRHELSACVALKFNDPKRACDWIAELLKDARNLTSPSDASTPRGGIDLGGIPLPNPNLYFGDGEPGPAAKFVALSAGGLEKLGVTGDPQTGMHTFPSAFLDGMSGRAAALNDPAQVKWNDSGWQTRTTDKPAEQDGPFCADAVLLFYIQSTAEMEKANKDNPGGRAAQYNAIKEHFGRQLRAYDIEVGDVVDMSRDDGESASLGGFGFHEGASQPKIRGTRWAAKRGAAAQDILAPGEFILGYEDLRGFVPPAVKVRDDIAARACLPHATDPRPEPYPYFGDPARGHMYDLGRNGSFLVIRQLEHNRTKVSDAASGDTKTVETFTAFAQDQARHLKQRIDGGIDAVTRPPQFLEAMEAGVMDRMARAEEGAEVPETSQPNTTQVNDLMVYSQDPTFLDDLVRAKMIGRWKDGSSLVRHPLLSASALLRRRTAREMKIILGAEEVNKLFRDRLVKEGEDPASVEGDLLDHMMWRDHWWEFFVDEIRSNVPSKHESKNRRIRNAILSHRWLKPLDEWPSMVDNDFNYGRDDPQGLGCPIGSHIRRSNPRDTPNPDNPDQFNLNNRHRIIRRGRPYKDAGGKEVYGTHFMCLNADIERQFEFIQRTWLNAPDFQGLVRQPDPIAAPHRANDRFVIPHTSNVTVMQYDNQPSCPLSGQTSATPERKVSSMGGFTSLVGGGYYFLPSRAALAYLAHPERLPNETAKAATPNV